MTTSAPETPILEHKHAANCHAACGMWHMRLLCARLYAFIISSMPFMVPRMTLRPADCHRGPPGDQPLDHCTTEPKPSKSAAPFLWLWSGVMCIINTKLKFHFIGQLLQERKLGHRGQSVSLSLSLSWPGQLSLCGIFTSIYWLNGLLFELDAPHLHLWPS